MITLQEIEHLREVELLAREGELFNAGAVVPLAQEEAMLDLDWVLRNINTELLVETDARFIDHLRYKHSELQKPLSAILEFERNRLVEIGKAQGLL